MEKIRIGDVCEILNGYAFKSENYVDDGIRIIRIANVQKGFIEDNTPAFYPLDSEGLDKYMLEEGDLLMSLTGNVGRVALLEKEFLPAVLNQRVACLRLISDKISKRYLFHILNSEYFERQCVQSSKGVAQKNMSTEWLKNYKIPLYSRKEQEKIVEILDRMRNVIDSRKNELQLLDNFVKARFVEMFGDPIMNTGKWNQELLSEVTSKIGSGATPKGGKESYQENGITLIRSMNVQNGCFEYKDLAHISELQAMQLDNVTVEKNDVFINITGASVARSCIVPRKVLPARVNQHVAIIRCVMERLNPVFVNNMFLNDSFKRQLLAIGKSGGATRQAITKQQLESLVVVLPPIELQNQFATFVHQVEKLKVAVQKAFDETQLLFDSLMQQYFG